MIQPPSASIIQHAVANSLAEDIGNGDITAALIDTDRPATATLITHEPACIAGAPWVNEVCAQVDPSIQVHWAAAEGTQVKAGQTIAQFTGPARSLLTAERTALNWLQTLSGVATQTQRLLESLAGSPAKLLDTRKTVPGLRHAQKYAVRCGGGDNHRMGLYDAYLIKENHIQHAGSIAAVIQQARQLKPDVPVEIEVENLEEFDQAQRAAADIIMLDNFSIDDIHTAVSRKNPSIKLEVSGNITLDNIHQYAATGVDFISTGSITKHIKAIDFSMRLYNIL